MIEQRTSLWPMASAVAEYAVQHYSQGLLTAEVVARQMIKEWEALRHGDDEPSRALFARIAQRICSCALCSAWRSPDPGIRNYAFENLRRYLQSSLQHIFYDQSLQRFRNAAEDVLHQTLLVLHRTRLTHMHAGPDDPASFLKWTQTVLIRQARAFLKEREGEEYISLDAQPAIFSEQVVDEKRVDPQEYALQRELQRLLKDAILSLKNPRYRQVLLCTYLADVDERELAEQLQVQVQDVYMWRHRALKAIRRMPEVMQVLRQWLRE